MTTRTDDLSRCIRRSMPCPQRPAELSWRAAAISPERAGHPSVAGAAWLLAGDASVGRFGVGHPTIREALKTLETMGYVERRPGSSVYVTRSEDVLLVASPDFGGTETPVHGARLTVRGRRPRLYTIV
ncbi:MAG: GntR family transcriptional regulator [Gemmatimonadota bacterium]